MEDKKVKHWNANVADEDEISQRESFDESASDDEEKTVSCDQCKKKFTCHQALGGHKSRKHPAKVMS
jgi:hypothetical protein